MQTDTPQISHRLNDVFSNFQSLKCHKHFCCQQIYALWWSELNFHLLQETKHAVQADTDVNSTFFLLYLLFFRSTSLGFISASCRDYEKQPHTVFFPWIFVTLFFIKYGSPQTHKFIASSFITVSAYPFTIHRMCIMNKIMKVLPGIIFILPRKAFRYVIHIS